MLGEDQEFGGHVFAVFLGVYRNQNRGLGMRGSVLEESRTARLGGDGEFQDLVHGFSLFYF